MMGLGLEKGKKKRKAFIQTETSYNLPSFTRCLDAIDMVSNPLRQTLNFMVAQSRLFFQKKIKKMPRRRREDFLE
jgi:hypothetical protein